MHWTHKPPLGIPVNWRHPLAKGLVGYWLMNEAGGNRVYDLSGNGNTGVLTNMAFPGTTTSGWTGGRDGPAVRFDASDDYVEVGNVISLRFSTDFTLAAWLNPSGTNSSNYGIISKWFGSYSYAFYCGANTTKPGLYVSPDGTAGAAINILAATGMPLNAWTNEVGVYRASQSMSLYRNGVLDAVNTSSIPASVWTGSDSTRIGAFAATTSTRLFVGAMSIVSAYARALSPHEVAQSYYEPWGIFDTPNVWYIPAVGFPFRELWPATAGGMRA